MNGVVSNVAGIRQRDARTEKKKQKAEAERETQNKFFAKLIKFEDDTRQITDKRELGFNLCNTSREVLPYSQGFFGTVVERKNKFTLQCASSIPAIDRDAPFTRWFEDLINQVIDKSSGLEQLAFKLSEFQVAKEDYANYENAEFLWTPQIHDKNLVGGFITVRDQPWLESDQALAKRITHLHMHAAASIKGLNHLQEKRINKKPIACGLLLLVGLAALIPVPITALAPVEVTPQDPFILTAPFDGVVKSIVPEQGQQISKDDLAIIFDDVHLNNSKQLAEQRAAVAQARYQRTSQGAIADYTIKRDIEVARAEYELAQSESLYASTLHEKSQLFSPIDGVAIFSDKEDWEGKPVAAGEAILSVANPESIEFSIDLPIKESLVIKDGAKVRIFLDSDPLNPVEAELTEASYSAVADKRDVLSYKLKARQTSSEETAPRIGVQGTAQVYGERSFLGYVIFRRPYSAFRQLTGW